jgi:GNAT superfamily N-acetyltransferase
VNISEQTMVTAIKANLFEYFDYLGRSPQAELSESPEMKWLITGIPHPFLNHVLRTQLTSSSVDARIGETLGYFHSKGITEFSWWTEPDSQPPDLGEHLLAHGLSYMDGSPGMACNLLKLNEAVTTPSEFTIKYVQDSAMLSQWVQVAVDGFGLPETCANTCFNLFAGLGFDLPLRNYVGFLNGKPVVSSQLFLGVGVAGIYWVSTMRKVRQRGFGTAITLAPLREARDTGYTIGILHATEMGYSVYQRMGFQELCKMNHFTATIDSM